MKPETGTTLLKTFEEFKKALFSCDKKALDKLIATDYRGFSIYGMPENKETILEVYGSGQVKLEKYEVDEEVVNVVGEIGIITGKGFIRGRFGEHIFKHNLRFCDIYIFRDKRWQLFITQGTEIRDSD